MYYDANMAWTLTATANVFLSAVFVFASPSGVPCHEPDSDSKARGSGAHFPSFKVSEPEPAEDCHVPAG